MIKPIHDRIIVRPLGEGISSGGIVIPQTAETPTRKGFVLCAGPGAPLPDGTFRAMQVQAGDVVLYGKFSGTSFDMPGEEKPVMLMREEDVFAVVDRKT